MSSIKRIVLENLTAFRTLDQRFSSGINIFIGANGTGKTHLLKTLYCACAITTGEDIDKSFGHKLRSVFAPYEGRVGRMVMRQNKSMSAKISVTRKSNEKLVARFSNHTNKAEDIKVTGETAWKRSALNSAYIPVKEMLAHAPGFLATASKREIAFEEVYTDIIKRAFLPKLRGPVDHDRSLLLMTLQKAIAGRVIIKGETFFLKNAQGDLEFTLLAEGLRKLALIWLLIQNGTLLSGSILFWDEPEANLNPSLMGEVVQVILELQRLGVQIFLSTHNYVLLKEFDLRSEKMDDIRYISLYRDPEDDNNVAANSAECLNDISPNALTGTFDKLYNQEIKRTLGSLIK